MVTSMPGMRLARQFLIILSCAVAVAAQAARGTPPPPPPVTWTFTDLGTLGEGAFATAVNNRGDVAGHSNKPTGGDPSAVTDAFIWSNGKMRDLGKPGRTNNQGVEVYDMNERGDLVGSTVQEGHAVVYRDHRWVDLGFIGIVRSINKSGDVAGNAGDGTTSHAFVIRNNVFWDLGTFGGRESWTHAINDRGQAVGFSRTPDDASHAFLWERGRIQDLGMFGGTYAEAVDINENGQILVVADNNNGLFNAVVVSSRGVATRPINISGNVIPIAINNGGDFVGSFNQDGHAYRGFVYYKQKLLPLDEMPAVAASGFTNVRPSAINDRDWIVGTGFDSHGQYRAFLLVPGR